MENQIIQTNEPNPFKMQTNSRINAGAVTIESSRAVAEALLKRLFTAIREAEARFRVRLSGLQRSLQDAGETLISESRNSHRKTENPKCRLTAGIWKPTP